MKAALLTAAGLGAGVIIGLAAPHFLHQKTVEECLMERMKGQPGVMFATVAAFCRSSQWPGRELTDVEAGITPKDDWQPITRK